MDKDTHHTQRKFISDKFDSENISSLSLFLYESLLVVISHTKYGNAISAANLYTLSGQNDLEQSIASDELINAPNTTGKLFLHHQGFTLVPGMVFNPAHSSLYLSFATEVDPEKDEVTYTGIQNNSIQVLGTSSKTLLQQLDTKLPELELAHGAAHVLDFFLSHTKDLLDQELFIHAAPNSIYIAGFKAGELMVFNRFIVHEEPAFLRYVFIVLKQLDFDQAHCRINLYGNLEWVHTSLENLRNYFKNIHQPIPAQKVSYQKGAENFKNTQLLEAFWHQH
ncbi:DUF3822 family protein [Cyclobacterium jeungdonense]|uniref:DUF3822 family protein n=1 Tax=Cyclobacterium jeungdonense TaxID=708087 RepID=A0ABT8C334_9BACT|nr:DUF3822 family protein [Cyclobacterium jeungdonense]MDN3686777.1 DUF3822 family protein [Cyclobacterium jeungdonense]